MLPICGAQLGTSIRCAISDIELTPRARPNSAIPIGNPIAISDPNATSSTIIATTSPIISLTPVSAASNAKNRSPPASICSVESIRASATSSSNRSRSLTSRSSRTGYWIDTTPTRPSPEIPSAVYGSLTASTFGSAMSSLRTRSTSARANRGVERHERIERGDDHASGQAGAVGARSAQQLDGLLRIDAGHLERVVEVAAERCRRGHERRRPRRATRRSHATDAGRLRDRFDTGWMTWWISSGTDATPPAGDVGSIVSITASAAIGASATSDGPKGGAEDHPSGRYARRRRFSTLAAWPTHCSRRCWPSRLCPTRRAGCGETGSSPAP